MRLFLIFIAAMTLPVVASGPDQVLKRDNGFVWGVNVVSELDLQLCVYEDSDTKAKKGTKKPKKGKKEKDLASAAPPLLNEPSQRPLWSSPIGEDSNFKVKSETIAKGESLFLVSGGGKEAGWWFVLHGADKRVLELMAQKNSGGFLRLKKAGGGFTVESSFPLFGLFARRNADYKKEIETCAESGKKELIAIFTWEKKSKQLTFKETKCVKK